MTTQHVPVSVPTPPPSPLMLCDRLISLAAETDRAGLATTAEHLVHLAFEVFDEEPARA